MTLLCLLLVACGTPGLRPRPRHPAQEPVASAPPAAQEPTTEESEVLEERRRGSEEVQVEPEAEQTGLYWDFGPRLDALRGDLTIAVGGRLHVDAATFSDDEDIVAAFGEPDPGVEVRRAFVELGGVYKNVEFEFWMNFAREFQLFTGETFINTNPDFRNVFVGLLEIPAVGGVRAGYFKEPFGLEEITSSNDITFMERSLTDAFIERRNLGVMLHRRFTEDRRMTASLGIYKEANNDLETANGYGVTGRVTGAPVLAENGRTALHFGLSATVRKTSEDKLRFLSRPESAQAQVMVDTGPFAADRDLRVGLEAATVLGSWSLQSEFVFAAARRPQPADDVFFPSVYVMGSYVLTGEHRSYRRRVGAFGAVHPDHPFLAGGAGAWELTGRYSYLNLDSADIRGGVLHDWTAGLNWYLNNYARVMFNYIAAHPEGVGTEHIVQARLQLNF